MKQTSPLLSGFVEEKKEQKDSHDLPEPSGSPAATLKRLQDFNFHGSGPFNVADGILPLAFTPPGGSTDTLKQEQEKQINSLALKDFLALQQSKTYVRLDWTRAITQLGSGTAKGNSSSNNNSSNKNRSSAGGHNMGHNTGSSTQIQPENPDQDSRLKNKSHPIVKDVDTWKMAKAIQTTSDNGKGPLLRPDGRERCHSWHIKGALRRYAKLDPAPSRVKPVPITLVLHALRFAYYDSPSPAHQGVANMICIAFFFCLRPGECTSTTRDDQTFLPQDFSFYYLGAKLIQHSYPLQELQAATSQCVLAKSSTSGWSCCPSSSPFSPAPRLASYIANGVLTPVQSENVTTSIRVYAKTLYPTTDISPVVVSAQSLCAGGTMALLQGKCDSNSLASLIFNNGTYYFLPEEWVPVDTTPTALLALHAAPILCLVIQ
eukprot:jgi/Psemu1/54868/gm1.54868_g